MTVTKTVSDHRARRAPGEGPSRPRFEFTWTDPATARAIPVSILTPETAPPWPVVIFSPGLGFTRFDYAYIKTALARAGLAAVSVQHPGSDDAIWRQDGNGLAALMSAALKPETSLLRPPDVSFVLDELARASAPGGPLAGLLNLARVGGAGHSMGAMTVLALAGAKVGNGQGEHWTFTDHRIKAVAAMSSRAIRKLPGLNPDFSGVAVPVLHLTGTEDWSPKGDITPADRQKAFQIISGVEQYLVVFNGGDHSTFLGRPERKKAHPRERDHHRLIARLIADFFRVQFLNDEKAAARLADPAALEGLAGLETKKA